MGAKKTQHIFNDVVAEQTDWTLLNTASSNIDPRKIVCVNSHRIEYRTTWYSNIFFGLFVVVGLGVSFMDKVWIAFALMGLVGLYWNSFPIVFDKKANLFSKGRRFDPFMKYVEIDLSEIYALQLIGGNASGSDGGEYNNYQINLVDKDSKRLNVVFFANKEKAKKSAIILKEFLNTRLWDAA